MTPAFLLSFQLIVVIVDYFHNDRLSQTCIFERERVGTCRLRIETEGERIDSFLELS